MQNLTMKVGIRTNSETFAAFRFQTELEAKRVWRVLNTLSETGQLGAASYAVVDACPKHGYEMLLSLAAGTDIEAQLAAVVAACREQLGLNVQRREMALNDYATHAARARAARAQDN